MDAPRDSKPVRPTLERQPKRCRSSYWLDATPADLLCKPAQWQVRDSFEAVLNDIRQTCRRLDPDEFRLLMIDGVVTFRIVEDMPGRGAEVVPPETFGTARQSALHPRSEKARWRPR